MNLHMYQVHLAKYSKGVYNMAVNVYNGLPYNLEANFSNPKRFRANLKDFLYSNSSVQWRNFLKDDCIIFVKIKLY
jgi:hypothetical protein